MKKRKQKIILPQGFEYLDRNVGTFLERYPYIDRNVFIMMPFSNDASESIYTAISEALENHGLIPLRADNHSFASALWWNIITYIIGSSYGVAVYEPSDQIPFNPNVSIEAGFMTALDKPVLFLTNAYLKNLPVDFSGHLFKSFSASNIKETINNAI